MSFQLTRRIIKLLCGPEAYERGDIYERKGNVIWKKFDPDASVYEAEVRSNSSNHIQVKIDANGDVGAECNCLAFYSSSKYCKHVAAVLFSIHNRAHAAGEAPTHSYRFEFGQEDQRASSGRHQQQSGQLTPRYDKAASRLADQQHDQQKDRQLVNHILSMFNNKPLRLSRASTIAEERQLLGVEFICKLIPYGFRRHMIGIELKLGPKRLYVAQQLKQLLERIEQRATFQFAKHFTYDPMLHSFRSEDNAVIQQLISIYRNEQLYQDTMLSSFPLSSSRKNNERMLLIPPFFWEALLPLLIEAPHVKIIHEQHLGRRTIETAYEEIRLSNELLPLHFAFDQADDSIHYQLLIQGLDELFVLEAYGFIFTNGLLIKVDRPMCKQLIELKYMLDEAQQPHIEIAPEQMEPFIERVIPGLMKLGSVRIAEAVSAKIIYMPLKARMYLDRVKDRLLAGLEFQYGDIVINPLEGANQQRGSERILMRDGECERQILALMDREAFGRTEGGYFIEGEDAEYELLYHIVPQLEKLLDIYATSAVKERLFTDHPPPDISISFDERTDWLEFKFELDGITEKEIRQLIQALEEKRRYYRLPNGALMPLESKKFDALLRVMNEVGLHRISLVDDQIRLPAARALALLELPQGMGSSVKLGRSLRQLLDNMRNPDNLDFPIPNQLEPVLRDYQKYGFQWMKTLAYYRFGGILADDMGLGKSVQSIAFIDSMLQDIRNREMPALIVAPASLMYNWHNELKKFAPHIRAVIADGTKLERFAVLNAWPDEGAAGEADHDQARETEGTTAIGADHGSDDGMALSADVIITSYPLLRRDAERYAQLSFHTLILDEAQAFKNYTTQTARAVKGLQAQYKFALTGTPIENRLEELWSIFHIVFPELFGDRKSFNELTPEVVTKRIRPFLLRRLKTDVLKELPEKIESLQASALLPEQRKLYAAYLAKLRQDTLKHLDSDDFGKSRIKILAGITRLRQLCCHPALFVEDYKGSSAKFEQLFQLIEECRSAGKRMLIFSQFTDMLGLIGRELGYQGIPFFYLDGQTPASERVALCDRFNDGERELFLISLKAGGTGLNLTGADTVILYDLWWNPAVEQQAADRAHRIGQKRIVQVIRLVAQGTVEDKMYELQQRKKNLIDEVIQPGGQAISALTEQEIREILSLE